MFWTSHWCRRKDVTKFFDDILIKNLKYYLTFCCILVSLPCYLSFARTNKNPANFCIIFTKYTWSRNYKKNQLILKLFKLNNLKINPLSANPTKWSNALKQFVGNLLTIFLTLFDHFVKLTLKGLIVNILNMKIQSWIKINWAKNMLKLSQ